MDSFVIYMCIGGELTLETAAGTESVKDGDTVLIPAETDSVTLRGKGTLLEVYIE